MDVRCKLLYKYILLTWLQVSSGQICMSNKIQNNKLQLVCNVKHLELEVHIQDPLGDQRSRCLIPYPKPSCSARNGDATQNVSSNMTVLMLNEDLRYNHRVNGEWSCLHGSKNERSSVLVNIQGTKDNDGESINVSITGPRTVKKYQAFNLMCSGTEAPENHVATFRLKNEVSYRITEMEKKCKPHRNLSACLDNKSYELVYKAPKSSGILTVTCTMNIQPFGKLTDCMFVNVVDLSGPFLSLDAYLPVFENTDLNIVCTAFSAENEIHLSWTCLNGTRKDEKKENSSTKIFISKLTYKVKVTDNGRICSCYARIGDFTSSDTLTLNVTVGSSGFHLRSLIWILTTIVVFIITGTLSTLLMRIRNIHAGRPKSATPRTIYFAAPQENRVNIYEDILHYDEIEN